MKYKNNDNKTVSESLTSTLNDVLSMWAKAQLPTTLKCNVVTKLKTLYGEWQKLKKNKENKKKQSQGLLNKQSMWNNKLNVLFDIAHANAFNLIGIEDDKMFLKLQREGQKGKMMGVDKKQAAIDEILVKKHDYLDRQRARETASFETDVIASNSSDSSPTTEGSNDDYVIDLEKPMTSGKSSLMKKRKISDIHLFTCQQLLRVQKLANSF